MIFSQCHRYLKDHTVMTQKNHYKIVEHTVLFVGLTNKYHCQNDGNLIE